MKKADVFKKFSVERKLTANKIIVQNNFLNSTFNKSILVIKYFLFEHLATGSNTIMSLLKIIPFKCNYIGLLGKAHIN